MVYCLFHLYWSCLLGGALPVEVALFAVLANLLDFGSWMKLILIVISPCYLFLKVLSCSTVVGLFASVTFACLSFHIGVGFLTF